MIDEPLTLCTECGGHIRRVIYPAGIVFKGSGFYKTDHGNGALVGSEHPNGKDENKPAETKPTEASKPSENGSSSPSTSPGSSDNKVTAATGSK